MPSRIKITKIPAFLHYFSKFRGILLFVLKYMYISLLLKMIDGFPDQQKSWPVPLNWTKCPEKLKGTGHDICWSGKPIYHLQKQGNKHIFQNKLQNPHKFAERMKKNRVFGKFHSWGSNNVFIAHRKPEDNRQTQIETARRELNFS